MFRKLNALLHRNRFESDMDAEFRAHREAYIDDLIARGMPRDEAEQRATSEFGAALQFKDECRDARGLYWPDALSRDFRYAARQLRKSPTFTLTAVATLALCIGANTAIYSVVDAVLFRPLPYPEPSRLVEIVAHRRGRGAEYEQIAQRGRTWEILHKNGRAVDYAVHSGDAMGINFVSPAGARYVKQQRVSTGFFRVLGVQPLLGREFTEEEDRPAGPAVAVLGNTLWRTVFHSDSNILGQKITLRGEPYTVVGVMPPGFQTSAPSDLWTPLRATVTGEGGGENFEIIGRLRAGTSWPQADAEMAALGSVIVSEWKLKPAELAVYHLIPLQAGLSETLRQPILILWSAVALVLLIGCVNIAGLLLARSGTRVKEIATRLALGSGRSAVIRQLLAESLLIASAGGAAGAALGYLALQGLKVFAQDTLGVWQTLSLDPRVLAVTAVTSIAAGMIFGLYPAFATSRIDLRSALAQGGRTFSAGHRGGFIFAPRRVLIVAEVSIGVVLLVGAGLLIRTLSGLMSLAPGFDGNHVVAATLSLQDARYSSTPAVNRLFDDSLARIRTIPGVESAAVCLTLPYQRALQEGFVRSDGPHAGSAANTTLTYITPAYLDAFRIPLLRGRVFTSADRLESQRVAIINESFARKYLGGVDAVGRHVKIESEDREIVGIAGDVQVRSGGGWGNIGPVGTLPGMYLPASQLPGKFFQVVHTWFSPSWVVRASVPLRDLTAPLQSAVASVDPQLPFSRFRTMDELRSESVALQRLETALLGTLAGLALFLSALGIYGLTANSVVERTREIGIRMALGSPLIRAIRDVALPGIVLSVSGLLIGCVLAGATAKLMKSIIWGIAPTDPATFMAAAGALLLVALISSVVPSLRVARINPADTLRD